MGKLIVTVGSVTTAARLEKILRKTKGISAAVIHTPTVLNNGGCSYSVVSNRENLYYIKETVKEHGLNVKKYYVEEIYRGEKRYHVIS